MGKQFILSRKLKGRIVGTAGSDRVRASKRSFAKPKFFIHREGSVSLLGGNDKIVSRYGMEVRGPIRMGAGCDVITGKKGLVVDGFDYQRGSLHMGPGADMIRFPKGHIGFVNGRDSPCVSMGGGNDGINGQSLRISDATDILMGAGNDQVESTDGMQVWGWSKLDMGEGNDSLRVQGGLVMDPGFIDMGSGDDTVDVEDGIQMYSYDDSSWIRLGEGNDRFPASRRHGKIFLLSFHLSTMESSMVALVRTHLFCRKGCTPSLPHRSAPPSPPSKCRGLRLWKGSMAVASPT